MSDPTPSLPGSVDIAVIGAGPAGTAAATLLAQQGWSVALCEKRRFPRFQIGESLVPAVNLTLERLGVLDRMDATRAPRKHAVQFFHPKGASRPFYFSEVDDPRMHSTWQVLRSEFDAMLLDNAIAHGVAASTETEVVDVLCEDDAVRGLTVRSALGAEQDVHARVVVDASGQQGIVARRFGRREHIHGLENGAVYAHYEGAQRDTGIDAGSTLIFRLDRQSWIWFIPLPDTVSVGLVSPARELASFGESPESILDAAIARCGPLAERLNSAQRTGEVRAVRDFSYRATRDGGRGWMLVGDALAFIDPIYSTGLFLAMHSAEHAAEAIESALRGANGKQPDFAGFAGRYHESYTQLLVLVRAYYHDDIRFGDLARDPTQRRGLIDLLTGVVGTPEAAAVTHSLRGFLGPLGVL